MSGECPKCHLHPLECECYSSANALKSYPIKINIQHQTGYPKKTIAIIGTHGTGKTTFSFLAAAHLKTQGHNVKIIQEVARSCPYPINESMSKEAALWIYHEHSRKELEAIQKHDIIISDRSSYDSFIYAKYFNLFTRDMTLLEHAAFQHLSQFYHKIILVSPDLPIEDDGIRSVDQKFQISIHEIFKETLANIPHEEINCSEIFDKDQRWLQFFS